MSMSSVVHSWNAIICEIFHGWFYGQLQAYLCPHCNVLAKPLCCCLLHIRLFTTNWICQVPSACGMLHLRKFSWLDLIFTIINVLPEWYMYLLLFTKHKIVYNKLNMPSLVHSRNATSVKNFIAWSYGQLQTYMGPRCNVLAKLVVVVY